MRDIPPDQLDAAAVAAAARDGDRVALDVLADVGEHLGRGIAYLLNILNPDLVVIGGAVAGAGDVLLDPVRRSVANHALDATRTEIVGSALGSRAELIGAVRLAIVNRPSSHRIVTRGFAPGA